MKYHIGKDGRPAECKATIKECRYSGISPHFDNLEKAQDYADLSNELEANYLDLAKEEEYITHDLKDAIKNHNLYLEGLDYRLKTLTSTKEKILHRGEANSIHELYDVIRYTAVAKTKDYQKEKDNLLKSLKKKGYKVIQEKNTWLKPGYKGINIKMETEDGVKFELQFHTEESLEAKEKAHKLYELYRNPNISEEEKVKLSIEMDKIFDEVPNPYIDFL